MSISRAREEAGGLRRRVQYEGADPIADRRQARETRRQAEATGQSLRGLLDLYEDRVGKTKKAWPTSRPRVENVFGRLLDRPLGQLTLSALQFAADTWPSGSSGSFAVRTLRPVLKWASAPGRAYISDELIKVVPPAAPVRRLRVLSRDELAAVLPVLRASSRPYAAAMRFLLLTLVRREEAGLLRWRAVDLRGGTFNLTLTKNTYDHRVPLSRQAVALLREWHPENPDPDAFVFPTSTGGHMQNWDRETKVVHKRSGTSKWHRHDLRRTGATLLGELNVIPDIVEAALNHVNVHSPLAATYNRSKYRPLVADALQKLADDLDRIEFGGAKILPLRKPG